MSDDKERLMFSRKRKDERDHARIIDATDVVVAASEYVVIRDCRHVVIEGCDDVVVSNTTGLRAASQNMWGDFADRLITNGDVGLLLKAKESRPESSG